MAKLNTLFDFTKFERRKTLEQQEFEQNNKQLLIDFKNSVPECLKDLHKKIFASIEPIDQDKNLPATAMNGFLSGQFKRKYPHYCYKATKQRFKLYIGDVSIYIKKLDEKSKLPSNIPTDESLKIFNQLTDSDSDDGCNIFLGYTVTDDWSRITGIYAVCLKGDVLLWKTDLNNFEEDSLTPIIPIRPTPKAPQVKDGAKRKKITKETRL